MTLTERIIYILTIITSFAAMGCALFQKKRLTVIFTLLLILSATAFFIVTWRGAL